MKAGESPLVWERARSFGGSPGTEKEGEKKGTEEVVICAADCATEDWGKTDRWDTMGE